MDVIADQVTVNVINDLDAFVCFGLLPAQRGSFSRIVYFGESDCRFHAAQLIADLRHDSAECFSADETFRVDHDVHLSEISSL